MQQRVPVFKKALLEKQREVQSSQVMQQGERIVRFNIAVGMNGSGKSHNMRAWRSLNRRNLMLPASRADKQWMGIPELEPAVVFLPDRMDPKGGKRARWVVPGINKFTQGERVVHIEGSDSERAGIFGSIIDRQYGFMNGGIFMDDAKNYITTKGNLPGNVRTFFGNRRLHMVDIFMAAWQYHDINADLYGFGPQLYIHNVEREPNKIVLEKMSDPDGFLQVHRWVRSVNLHLPKDYRWFWWRFPSEQAIPKVHPELAAAAFARKFLPPAGRLAMGLKDHPNERRYTTR